MKSFLHVGCGLQNKTHLRGFNGDGWAEIRFDIDPDVKPDIEGTLTDMGRVATGSVDALYSSHNIEHLFAHEVPLALNEFHRVLRPDGFVVLGCPDLQGVCEAVAQGNLLEPLFVSTAGPVSAMDMLYGLGSAIARGNAYMAHKTGFTLATLQAALFGAGFQSVLGGRRPNFRDMWMVAAVNLRREDEMRELAMTFVP